MQKLGVVIEAIESVTGDDIQRAANHLFRPATLSLALVGPLGDRPELDLDGLRGELQG